MIPWLVACAASASAVAATVAWRRASRLAADRASELVAQRSAGAVDATSAESAVRRIERAVCALREGVVLADEQGEVVFRNDAAVEVARGRHTDALVDAAVQELLAGAVGNGRTDSRTLELYGPPRRTVIVSARPLLFDGRAVGALAVVDDVTDRRRLEAIRRDFVANISHELKTPVGALMLLAETVADSDDRELTRRLAARLVTESTRLGRTIDDLLVLSRIEVEDAPVREPVVVADIVTEAVARITSAADAAGIDLEVGVVDKNLVVQADRRQLVSALSNLLDNAVKYSGAGTSVAVRVTTDGREVALSVADRGIGIPAKDLERVFQRFYRVDDARSRQTGGTGLGLAIVRHVMVNHTGDVSVDSRLGAGSTFTLRLPVAVAGPVGVDTPQVFDEGNAHHNGTQQEVG